MLVSWPKDDPLKAQSRSPGTPPEGLVESRRGDVDRWGSRSKYRESRRTQVLSRNRGISGRTRELLKQSEINKIDPKDGLKK